MGQFVIAASSYIQWLVVDPDIRRIPLAPFGRLAIWRRSVDGRIDELLFDNSDEGCTYTIFSLRTLPPEGGRVSSVCLGMSGAGATLSNL